MIKLLKKLFYLLLTSFLFIIFNNFNCLANEKCHIFLNEEYYDSLDYPFYLTKHTQTPNFTHAFPTIETTSSNIYIDTKEACEEINYKVITYFTPLEGTFYYYSYFNNEQEIVLKNNNDLIKGYSSLIDYKPPTFTSYFNNYKVNINDVIPLENIISTITAYDDYDGNVTDSIIIEYDDYSSNTSKVGNYLVILSVSDSSNNKATFDFHIEIYDNEKPIIEGENEYTSLLSNPLDALLIKKDLIVYDNVDSGLEKELYICEDNYTSFKDNPGNYNLSYCVSDYSNNISLPFVITIKVKDDIAPTIEGITHCDSYLSKPLTVKEILYSLVAYDNEIDYTSSIFITKDYYSTYLNTPGEKYIFLQAMDESNNVSEPYKITINLIDDVKPQIFGLNYYTSYLSSPLTISYLKQQLTALDNINGDITSSLEVIEDSYSNNINKLGTFYLTFICKDNSSNSSENFKITIETIDDVVPTINGEHYLEFELANKPSIDDILCLYIAKDNIDTNLSISIIKDTFSDSLTTGTYYLELLTEDASNNKSLPFLITIEISTIVLKVNKVSLYLSTSNLLSLEEINSIINFTNEYTLISNSYNDNYNIEGEYLIEYELEDESKLQINVITFLETEEIIETLNEETKKETFLDKIKCFFNKIIEFFKNLFSFLNIHQYFDKL